MVCKKMSKLPKITEMPKINEFCLFNGDGILHQQLMIDTAPPSAYKSY